MKGSGALKPSTWTQIRLVAFDVDGTLYDQRRLRVLMALEIALHCIRSRSQEVFVVVRAFRRIREELGDKEVVDFHPILLERTAEATGRPPELVEAIVREWIDLRPIRHLASCRYPGLMELFDGLRQAGKEIGLLSDYPVMQKLQALGLRADHVVCATDSAIGVLKPNVKGLRALIDAAGVKPSETLVIGDRADRDGLVAQRLGTWALIRASKPLNGWQCFRRFDEPIFDPVLRR